MEEGSNVDEKMKESNTNEKLDESNEAEKTAKSNTDEQLIESDVAKAESSPDKNNHALPIVSKADGIVVSSSGKVVSSQVVVPAVNVAKNFHPSAIVCKEATIEGDVSIGAGTIVHPFAIIRAIKGPIIIGENNNIEERCIIENMSEGHVMLIGDENNIEADSIVHALSIGDRNVIQGKSEVGPGVLINDGCTIGAKCQLLQKGSIPARTVIWGKENRQRIAYDNPEPILPILEIYRKVLPSYHHLYKATSKD